MLFAQYEHFRILVEFGQICGRLLGNMCTLGLQYALLVKLPDCQFSFSHLGFWSGYFFLIVTFPDHCLLFPFSYIAVDDNAKIR